ncbi:hypothetical protein BAE44_0016463 [Dichanthelium oligosanthes]|uniref:Uncharacterized protein n=1 Tax=Dichanthelium oligosanthes TaxID=888268 RepID=A0A1E5VBI6_9POAL|nr:hypothetical protein BAE44_0016463 [Dichanthelium oligosanthes]
MPDPAAAASSGPPAWVLLESFARVGDRRNETTATGLTSARRPVQVSFDLADPPGVSRWFAHCPASRTRRGAASTDRP